LQGGREVGPSASIGEALAQLGRQLSLREPAHALESPGGTLTGTDGKSQQLGDSRELGEHLSLTLGGRHRQHLVPSHDTGSDSTEDEEHKREDSAAVLEPPQRGHHESEHTTTGAPDDLLRAEALDIGSQARTFHPPPHGSSATQQPLDATTEIMDHGVQDQQPPGTAGLMAYGKESRWPGCVTQVWRKTGFEPGTPVDRKTHEDQQATDNEDHPESGPEPGPPAADQQTVREQTSHRRTRPSSGRRPTRTIKR
jgi:hypothetical protein